MKIAYYLVHDLTKGDGVVKKIKSQVIEWTKLGLEVRIFAISDYCDNPLIDANIYGFSGFISSRVRLNKKLLADLDDFNPDLVYLRYDTLTANISYLSKRYKIICELNTIDKDEAKLFFKNNLNLKSSLRLLAFYLLRKKFFNRMSGLIAVTQEILNDVSISRFDIPKKCISNSLHTSFYPTIKENSKHKDRISLFFMGSPNQPWQGFDKIEQLAKLLPEFDFHVVGLFKESSNNLKFHGFLSSDEYLPIMKESQICIGTLALYRKKMNEACPLKVREYLAYGFPIIIGYEESMFNQIGQMPDWALKVDPKNLDVNVIREFCLNMRDKVVSHEEIIPLIDSSVLEGDRVDFFKEIVKK